MIHIALAAGSLPFIAVLVYLKLRAQREKRKRENAAAFDRWILQQEKR